MLLLLMIMMVVIMLMLLCVHLFMFRRMYRDGESTRKYLVVVWKEGLWGLADRELGKEWSWKKGK